MSINQSVHSLIMNFDDYKVHSRWVITFQFFLLACRLETFFWEGGQKKKNLNRGLQRIHRLRSETTIQGFLRSQ